MGSESDGLRGRGKAGIGSDILKAYNLAYSGQGVAPYLYGG